HSRSRPSAASQPSARARAQPRQPALRFFRPPAKAISWLVKCNLQSLLMSRPNTVVVCLTLGIQAFSIQHSVTTGRCRGSRSAPVGSKDLWGNAEPDVRLRLGVDGKGPD